MSSDSISDATASWRLPPTIAFPALAFMLFAFFFAASAPSPLFLVMQRAWHFSPSMLTMAFAVYCIALLGTLLVAGSLSDHLGRRPVIFGALVIQAIAMAIFLTARGVTGLLLARIVQGIATGAATGALTAAVVEAAPAAQKRFGTMVSSVSPMAGFALGALVTGILVKYTAHPVGIMFGVLVAIFALCAVLMLMTPETASRRPGLLASLVPRVSVPPAAKDQFLRAIAPLIAVWALAGLYLALAPSILLHVFRIDNGLLNGLSIAVLAGVGTVAPTALKRLSPAAAASVGLVGILVGVLLLIVSLPTLSIALFFIGTALCGIGFGGTFSNLLQILSPLAQTHERSELFATVFVVCYLAFSVPAMIAGALVAPLGLKGAVDVYAVFVAVVAAIGLAAQWKGVKSGL